jgi:hypothetical protein
LAYTLSYSLSIDKAAVGFFPIKYPAKKQATNPKTISIFEIEILIKVPL